MSAHANSDCKEQEKRAVKIIVTAHARQRFRERVGLSKNACQVQAQIVYDYGFTFSDAEGKAKAYTIHAQEYPVCPSMI